MDVIECDYSFDSDSEGSIIEIDLSLKNYGKDRRISNTFHTREYIPFSYKEEYSEGDLYDTHYFYDDYKIILSRDDEELEIV